MATLNEVRLIGNLGGDPKVRDANGTAGYGDPLRRGSLRSSRQVGF